MAGSSSSSSSHRSAQYEPVIRNDKRGGADEGPRATRAPVRKPTAAPGEDEHEDVGDRVRRKLREAATVEELQAAVNEVRSLSFHTPGSEGNVFVSLQFLSHSRSA